MNKICKRLLSMAIALVLVLSMVPASYIHVHAAETTSITYDFGTIDGSTVTYSSLTLDENKTPETLLYVDEAQTASLYVCYMSQSETNKNNKVTDTYLGLRRRDTVLAIRLTGIPAETKEYNMSVTTASTNTATEIYFSVLPGNTTAAKIMESPKGYDKNLTVTSSVTSANVTIKAEDVLVDSGETTGSVILVIYAGGTGWDCHVSSMTFTEVHECAGAAATCTTAQICDVCEKELAPALGHIWVSPTTSSAAYCSRSGCEVAADGVVSVVTEAGGQYVYDTNYTGKTYEVDGRNWIADMGHSIGKFVHYAESNKMLEGKSGASAYTPTKSTENAGSWVAFMFNVGQQGTYGITMDIATSKAIQAYIVAGDYLEFGRAVEANNTKVNDLETPFEIAASEEFNTNGRPVSYTAHCGDMTLDAGEYLLILKTKEASTLITFVSMELHCSNVQGANNTYTSVANAIGKGETNLTLIGDITEDVAVINNATLNLNGKNITGDVAVTYGTVEGEGNVSGTLFVPTDHDMPLSDGNGNYKFFTPTNVTPAYQKNATTGYDEYWFDILLDSDAYTRIATGKSGMKVKVDITWKPADWVDGDEVASKAVEFAGDAVTAWANGELDEENYGLCVQFTNIPENVSEVTVTVKYTANGAAVVYESPVAANG